MAERQSQIVLGLDPDPAALWRAIGAGAGAGSPARRVAAAVREHCGALIEAAGGACVAVKLQLACFERLGAPGWEALGAVAEHARAAGLLVIADAKRGDIEVSARAYAQALIGGLDTEAGRIAGLGADAVTVNPLLGEDSLEPWLASARRAGAGLFVLVRTSNPRAGEIQELELAGGGAVWERLAALVARLGAGGVGGAGISDVGAV
ncbi:MAG: orotidine-5'-phosphate decarboxylase, partial [Solirubrobacterales bacterium]|nr:orotidine-5'-phosphate decarboxylase [Solirubrobacterales bacterium]